MAKQGFCYAKGLVSKRIQIDSNELKRKQKKNLPHLCALMLTGQLILIDKPFRWTSFDVVKKVKNVLVNSRTESRQSKLKVGHAGTLDPLATGLLILCTGNMTKKISIIQDAEKEYSGSFVIGSTTPSYDLETALIEGSAYDHMTREKIEETTSAFRGKILQTPPAHSAVKVNGVRAYAKARKGQPVDLEPKEVHIKEFEITGMDLPRIDFRVICSKGTYIRSLANDFGKALGCGAHLSSLCRTRIGEYFLKDALSMDDFISQYSSETKVPLHLISC